VDELMAADTTVIAAAMINFTIPSTLKSWIDYVARPGRTFSYSESGPKGLVTGKRVFLVVARGVYGDRKQFDFQLPYLLHVLAFLGMTDVEMIDIEGSAFGPQAAERAVAAVRAAVGTIALERRAA
jgi:FMN-dependent NADH-azoreductase